MALDDGRQARDNGRLRWPAVARSSKVTSNAAFLVPAVVAFADGLAFTGMLALVTAVVSTAYHLSGERRWGRWDSAAAWLLVVNNGRLLWEAGFTQPFATLAVTALAGALWVFLVERRDGWEWHTASALVTLMCVLSFVHGGE